MGIQLAQPDKLVIGFTGDGGSMYTIQALQTAARYGINAKFVVIHNGSYQLLKDNLDQYRANREIPPHKYLDCFSLAPEVDFVALSRSMQIPTIRLTTENDSTSAVEWLLQQSGLALIEVVET